MYLPSSTYRLQFNNSFTFRQLKAIIPYLSALKTGAIYASPVFSAVPGSNHGYDVTDPLSINEEIGTLEEMHLLIRKLKSRKIGWIQDIVPNHMAFHPRNHWLMDVLQKGKESAFSAYFDIDWEHPVYRDKVIVPILAKTLDEAVKSHEIRLEALQGGFFIVYFDFNLPVSNDSIDMLKEHHPQRIAAFCRKVNDDPSLLTALISRQHYVLTHWQETENTLNYRRFFTINGLISLRMENDEVFEKYHGLIFRIIREEQFNGLRIDHVDGLKKTSDYLDKLRAQSGENVFMVVEKILEHNEQLERNWPLQGSTGYDFLALVNNVFTGIEAWPSLFEFYQMLCDVDVNVDEYQYRQKKMILNRSFRGDLDNICRMITDSGLVDFSAHVTKETLREAVGEFLSGCPVYKLYSTRLPLAPEDAGIVKGIFHNAVLKYPHLRQAIRSLENIFLNPARHPEKAAEIFLKLMQYTGPLMAKGVEDTSMYSFSAFIAHNEVGDAINAPGISIHDFHRAMTERRKFCSASLNATATHDTKRGEDARARLNVISNISSGWMQWVKECISRNQRFKSRIHGKDAPDVREEYFIYQTLLGVMPPNGKPDDFLISRLEQYFQKSLREAKVHSDWNEPDEDYERAVIGFIHSILQNHEFLVLLKRLLMKVKAFGIINSLSQVVLKCTCPGIPDFYQGTELWDLSLVDPDNRRPVDYSLRRTSLRKLNVMQEKDPVHLFKSLWQKKDDGRIKLWITHQLMSERASEPEAFVSADYQSLSVVGAFKDHVLAFARSHKETWYITIVPLHLASHFDDADHISDWKDTRIELPMHAPDEWNNIWDRRKFHCNKEIKLDEVMTIPCPVVLKGRTMKIHRGSGILLHLSSLPGKFGIGNLGEEACRFVDYLKKCGQKYWQILPFNPVGDSFSPYSSSSAFAGNTLFIDPETLLSQHHLRRLPAAVPESDRVNYRRAKEISEEVIRSAFDSSKKYRTSLYWDQFNGFCTDHRYWLDDFACFSLLKARFKKVRWNAWPDKYKNREAGAIAQFVKKHENDLLAIKFGQFLFHEQFTRLKTYANSFGISIIGDIPIYVSYDSADVWARPEIFNLDEEKNMRTVTGVPPDFYSSTGQLWNMPAYNWQKMREDHYGWWIKRISKNLEFCNMLRFDHFRGFSAYWEVPAAQRTARNGRWTKGPGAEFFRALKVTFPEMPFIAEDLGDIDEDVYRLRDLFTLPGMKVLQFAFSGDMPRSIHSMHHHSPNSVVYTGTHDSNTLKGWFQENNGKAFRNRITGYTGKKVTHDSVAWEFIRMAMSSVARIAIIPMQDILELDGSARMNTPAQAKGNWLWKMTREYSRKDSGRKLLGMSCLYGRV